MTSDELSKDELTFKPVTVNEWEDFHSLFASSPRRARRPLR